MSFPFFHQLESIDCGPTCLRMIAAYYGKNYSLQELKDNCNVTRLGITLQDIVQGAKKIGFETFTAKASLSQLKETPLPAVLFWRQEHYIVLHNIKTKKNKTTYYIADPAYGRIQLNEDMFCKEWLSTEGKGIVLILQPAEEFYKHKPDNKYISNNINSIIQIVKNSLFKHKRSFSIAFILFALAMLTNWAFPILFQKIIDKGVIAKNIHIVWLFILAQLALFLGNIVFDSISSILLVKINFKIGINFLYTYLHKLIRLPIKFFDTRLNTDLIQRMDDQDRIQNYLTYKLIQFIFSLFNLIAFSFLLAYYRLNIFLIFVIASIASVYWITLFLQKRKILDYSRFSVLSENKNNIYELIMTMPEIKINNAQHTKISQWQNLQHKFNKIVLKALYLNYYQLIGVSFFNKIKDIIITGLCAYYVINNTMTLGVMMGISYILGQLKGPIDQIVDFIRSSQDAKLSFERLDEIQKKEDENNINKKNAPSFLDQGIYLKNISFKYEGSYNPYIFKDINLYIPKGKITAIVGASGSGKTTLLKLLLSFYTPQSGEVLLDNTNLTTINADHWRNKCGVVMQNGHIYSGTIAENIAIAENKPDKIKLQIAAETACIHNFIDSLPMKYNTKIGKSGIDLSGGQKQRLLIARAVYKNPQFILFDEATSSLDANNEKAIMQNLDHFFRNKTVIVIAHRLSTVKNADQIIVLDKGKVIETGTHVELSQNKNHYYELVKNQLELGT